MLEYDLFVVINYEITTTDFKLNIQHLTKYKNLQNIMEIVTKQVKFKKDNISKLHSGHTTAEWGDSLLVD